MSLWVGLDRRARGQLHLWHSFRGSSVMDKLSLPFLSYSFIDIAKEQTESITFSNGEGGGGSSLFYNSALGHLVERECNTRLPT